MLCVLGQGLSESAGSPVRISFTPTLMPMSRGMQSTIYVKLANGASADDLRSHLQVRPHRQRWACNESRACLAGHRRVLAEWLKGGRGSADAIPLTACLRCIEMAGL